MTTGDSPLQAFFNYTYGAVSIEVRGGMPIGGGDYVVKRAVPSQDPSITDLGPWTLDTIRGYDTPGWVEPGDLTGGPIYDSEMPLGVDVMYFLVPTGQKTADSTTEPRVTIPTPENLAWLRDLYEPSLTQSVVVVSVENNNLARQSIYNVVGRTKPMVVWDLRLSRSGTVVLRVQNQTFDKYRETKRDRMDRLLATGRPLLLSLCQSKGFDPCWMAISDARYTRLGSKPTWTLELDYTEVDSPIGYGVTAPAEMTYAKGMSVPAAGATYAQWWSPSPAVPTFDDYFELVAGRVT